MNIPLPTLIALLISAIALLIAVRNYHRKSGVLIRGFATSMSSISCTDTYISSIVLDNLKDKAVTIFAIYYYFEYGYYITLEDLSEQPLILRAFETVRRDYGPVEFYSCNQHRLDMQKLFKDNRLTGRIVLSTNSGKYSVPDFVDHWNPTYDFFRNHMTAVIHPIRVKHKGKDVGDRIKYVVELSAVSSAPEVVMIHHDDHRRGVFVGVSLTEEALATGVALKKFLDLQMSEGKMRAATVTVYDMDDWRTRNRRNYESERVVMDKVGRFQYYVLGRIETIWSNRQINRENKRRQLELKKTPPASAITDSSEKLPASVDAAP